MDFVPHNRRGTSFAYPFFFGKLALVQQLFKEKAGRTLNQMEIINFVQDHIIDLGEEGHDEYFGHGLFILPNSDDIQIEKYLMREGDILNNPDKIIIHRSATNEGTFESIKRYHIEVKGWDDIGYHYLITTDGTIHKGRNEEVTGAHTKGENQRSIGICLIGDFDSYKPNKEQLEVLLDLMKDIFNRYGKLPIYGHNDFSSKTCPGTKFPMEEVISIMSNNIKEDVSEWAKESQEWVIENNISDGSRPKDTMTREEMWTMLYRYHEKYGK